MYVVNIKSGNEKTTIHGHSDKLVSGNIVKGAVKKVQKRKIAEVVRL